MDGASTSRSSAGGLTDSGQQQQQHQRHVVAGAGLQVLAVGDAYGVLHLFELPRTLRRPLPNEHKLMAGFVAREAARVADVTARQVRRVCQACGFWLLSCMMSAAQASSMSGLWRCNAAVELSPERLSDWLMNYMQD
jgi:hypothetical protein